VQELIDLDPTMLEPSAKPVRYSSTEHQKGMQPSIKDFTLLRVLASGGFAQVWLAKKKTTGDVFAVKALRKEYLRETEQVTI